MQTNHLKELYTRTGHGYVVLKKGHGGRIVI